MLKETWRGIGPDGAFSLVAVPSERYRAVVDERGSAQSVNLKIIPSARIEEATWKLSR